MPTPPELAGHTPHHWCGVCPGGVIVGGGVVYFNAGVTPALKVLQVTNMENAMRNFKWKKQSLKCNLRTCAAGSEEPGTEIEGVGGRAASLSWCGPMSEELCHACKHLQNTCEEFTVVWIGSWGM